MQPIPVGAEAPLFSVKDHQNQAINLIDLRGKKVLLSWHPLAWTPV